MWFEVKRNTRKFNVGAKACAERDTINEKPDMKRNKGRVPSKQDHTQLSFQLVERKKEFTSPKM